MDFSFMSDARRRWSQIADDLAVFQHPLLVRLSYVDSFEGGSVPAGRRSFTVRAELGAPDRTLGEADLHGFRGDMTELLTKLGLELR